MTALISSASVRLMVKGSPFIAVRDVRRALAVSETLGPDLPETATALDNLAGAFVAEEKFAQAEPLYQRALLIREITTLSNYDKLASVYVGEQKYLQAEQIYRRALAFAEKSIQPDSVQVGMVMERYAELLRLLNRPGEAERMRARLRQIRQRMAQEAAKAAGADANAQPKP